MKTCIKCGCKRNDECFALRNKVTGVRNNTCKVCHKAYRDQHYRDNKQKDRARIYARKQAIKAQFKAYKQKLSCVVCGEDESCCLDFHHTSNEKERAVGQLVCAGCSWDTIMAEVNKCIIICSNCHRKIHAGKVSLAARVISNH